MEEINRKRLDEALANLPQHEPDPNQWSKIEAFLDFDDRLQHALPELPEYEPTDLIWNRIEEALEPQTEQETAKPATRIIPLFRYAAAISASVLLLLVARYFVQHPAALQGKEKVQIAYSEEVVATEPHKTLPEPVAVEAKGLAFIEEQCNQLPDACQSPEFVELKTQLAQLEQDEKQIQADLALYGEDPMLVQSQIKIENLKSEITKELIQLIIS